MGYECRSNSALEAAHQPAAALVGARAGGLLGRRVIPLAAWWRLITTSVCLRGPLSVLAAAPSPGEGPLLGATPTGDLSGSESEAFSGVVATTSLSLEA